LASAPVYKGLCIARTFATKPYPVRQQIVITTTDLPPDRGGIQRVVHELATRLAERDWSVTVVAPHNPNAGDYDAVAPFRVLRASTRWDGHRARCVLGMSRLVAGLRADVFVAAHVNALLPLSLARADGPRVVLLHGQELWAPVSRSIARLLARRVDRAMAVSRFTAGEAMKVGIPHARIALTPLAAAAPPVRAAATGIGHRLGVAGDLGAHPFFLTISRLAEPHKGQDTFLRSMPQILSRHPDTRYVVVGEGPLASPIRSLAFELGVGHALLMPGAVDEAEKGELLGACTAYVMVSRELRRPALFEGFGIAYLEAAFAGRPSLAGDTGGVRDAVVDGETGVLVDPDSVDEVANAALRFLDDPAYADGLGAAAKRRAEQGYTWEVAIARMEAVLREAMLGEKPER
jgi:phosphatidylinositol alpha-1,6-mannosyltransferase